MTEKLTAYDPANALVDDEEIAFFLAEAHTNGDAGYIAKALQVVERARLLKQTVRENIGESALRNNRG